jgi:2-succinyl-5-enolpyruvyl-6-hydroxy-3-cyclohexene-1-carboxylate synthase
VSEPLSSVPDPACIGLRWCLALLDGLAAGGVRHLVLSPGSRSTPVVLAAQRQGAMTLTPILDERSAAFYALGLARASDRPVALLATSGSAPAHWYPAIVEASESGVPLVLISADRPPELRGWGANQTIDQTRLFGAHVRAFFDPGPPGDGPQARRTLVALGLRAAAASHGRRPGPLHINLPLPEPLVPSGDCGPWDSQSGVWEVPRGDRSKPDQGPARLPPDLQARLGGRGVICCGPERFHPSFAPALWRCARVLGVPVLADPLSGLRFGPASEHRIVRYDTLLRSPATARALRPDWVLRFGRAPVSRTLIEWLAGVPSVLVDPAERWADPTHDLVRQIVMDPGSLCEAIAADPWSAADPGWLEGWIVAERAIAELAEGLLAERPWCEAHLIGDLIRALPAGDGLCCANSLPIRQLDTWSGSRQAPLAVFGNRGVSGIDGQMSTLAGINAGGTPAVGLLGDLSFLHDLSGLMLADRLDRPCIVLNNGGGRIFDYLPQHGLPDFERLWRTPRALDLGALVRTFGLGHRRVEDAEGWRQALAEGLSGGPGGLIEVMVDAPRSQDLHRELWGQVRARTSVG